MGKKVREYKSGDFIFAKVKGYPAWPARVQKMNGKKYFVYFYGTGETANLPPNMIFDYAENKDKFLTKTVKRRDFNDGVKQIEHDFANNVPLEQVIGAIAEEPEEAANDSANDTANETMDDTAGDTTAADETMADEIDTEIASIQQQTDGRNVSNGCQLSDALLDCIGAFARPTVARQSMSAANATSTNDTAVEDSDDAALVIDEGKKGRKPKDAKTPAKETPAKPAKEPKTPRGKAKKDTEKEEEEEKNKEEEIVSRSGRKIRPKRYIDEQTEENATLPSPLPKKRRGASPAAEKEKEPKDAPTGVVLASKKKEKMYHAVPQSELEDLKEPFKQENPDTDNILLAYLPSGQYIGVKLFQSRPASFKNDSTRLQWDKRAASNALTLKLQLERGQITPQSVQTQLVMDIDLTDEEKATMDKERETEEKKSRVQFLKTEMKLIELDAKIKTCLCLEKADTELCLKLLDELMELDVKPLMLLKHPTCLETVKRMRAYVGNTPSWDLSESAALLFSKQAHRIRRQADALYKSVKELFVTPEGLSFWEYFSERVLQFKKATAKLSADELLELVHEPLEMTMPTSHTMKAAVDAANEEEPADEEDSPQKKKATNAKPKKNATNTPTKPPLKRQSSRKQQQEEKEKEKEKESKTDVEEQTDEQNKPEEAEKPQETEKDDVQEESIAEKEKEVDGKEKEANGKEAKNKEPANKKESKKDTNKESKKDAKDKKEATNSKEAKDSAKDKKEAVNSKEGKKDVKNKEKDSEVNEEVVSQENEVPKESEQEKEKSPSLSDKDKSEKKDSEEAKEDKAEEKDKDISEPRAKRSRESKKTEPPPPRSPAKRKSKF